MGLRLTVRRHAGDEAGMSLVEMLIVATMIPIVVALALGLLQLTTRVANNTEAQDKATSATRFALDSFEKDLRQGQEIVEGGGAFRTVLANKVEFYADVDHDALPEVVAYEIVGQGLVRRVFEPSTAAAPYTFAVTPSIERAIAALGAGAANTGFAYYDNAEPPNELTSAQAPRISAVRIRVVATAHSGDIEKTSDLTTWVRLRAVNSRID